MEHNNVKQSSACHCQGRKGTCNWNELQKNLSQENNHISRQQQRNSFQKNDICILKSFFTLTQKRGFVHWFRKQKVILVS